MSEQKREHFRIVYPAERQARVLVRSTEYYVLDISQQGVKFSFGDSKDGGPWDVGTVLKAKIMFLACPARVVAGKILRTSERDVTLYLDQPIELKVMYDEHRYVINNFYKNAM